MSGFLPKIDEEFGLFLFFLVLDVLREVDSFVAHFFVVVADCFYLLGIEHSTGSPSIYFYNFSFQSPLLLLGVDLVGVMVAFCFFH